MWQKYNISLFLPYKSGSGSPYHRVGRRNFNLSYYWYIFMSSTLDSCAEVSETSKHRGGICVLVTQVAAYGEDVHCPSQCLRSSNFDAFRQFWEPMSPGPPSMGSCHTISSVILHPPLEPWSHAKHFPGFRNLLPLTPWWIWKVYPLISIHQEHEEISLPRASHFTEEKKSYSLPVLSASSLIWSQRRVSDGGRPHVC